MQTARPRPRAPRGHKGPLCYLVNTVGLEGRKERVDGIHEIKGFLVWISLSCSCGLSTPLEPLCFFYITAATTEVLVGSTVPLLFGQYSSALLRPL